MEVFARHIVQQWENKGYISAEEVDWCLYGLLNRLTTLFTALSAFILGSIVLNWQNTMTFLLCVLALRKYSNGYHAKHYLNCFALTLMIVFVSLSLVNHLNHIIATILFSISSMIIFEFAPTNSSSLHLSTQEMKAMRGKVRVRLAVLSGIMILFLFFDLHKAYCIVLAITVVAILLLPSAIAVYFNKQGEKVL